MLIPTPLPKAASAPNTSSRNSLLSSKISAASLSSLRSPTARHHKYSPRSACSVYKYSAPLVLKSLVFPIGYGRHTLALRNN